MDPQISGVDVGVDNHADADSIAPSERLPQLAAGAGSFVRCAGVPCLRCGTSCVPSKRMRERQVGGLVCGQPQIEIGYSQAWMKLLAKWGKGETVGFVVRSSDRKCWLRVTQAEMWASFSAAASAVGMGNKRETACAQTALRTMRELANIAHWSLSDCSRAYEHRLAAHGWRVGWPYAAASRRNANAANAAASHEAFRGVSSVYKWRDKDLDELEDEELLFWR